MVDLGVGVRIHEGNGPGSKTRVVKLSCGIATPSVHGQQTRVTRPRPVDDRYLLVPDSILEQKQDRTRAPYWRAVDSVLFIILLEYVL